jgi:hypothetical protein
LAANCSHRRPAPLNDDLLKSPAEVRRMAKEAATPRGDKKNVGAPSPQTNIKNILCNAMKTLRKHCENTAKTLRKHTLHRAALILSLSLFFKQPSLKKKKNKKKKKPDQLKKKKRIHDI